MANITAYSEDNLFIYSGQTADFTEDMDSAKKIMKNINGIFGAPYQFTDIVDPRPNINDSDDVQIGATYATKILGPMNLLMLVPCRQVFMKGFSESDKGNVLSSIVSGNLDVAKLVEGSGKYYTTKLAYNDYYRTVNILCRAMAYFMGIENEIVYFGDEEGKAGDIDYENVNNSALNSSPVANKAVMFYIDGGAEQTESFSNESMESSLASSMDGYSSQMNEIRFLVGEGNALSALASTFGELSSNIGSNLENISGALAGDMLASLAKKGVHTILNGGKIKFPKIWSGSGFSRSYSFELKLRSPDHDNVSIFMNLFVPLMHLLALTLPIGMDEDVNAYKSPFLVKAYDKGFFNIDMGLITGLSVTRGGECEWNDDGLPTQINISIEIEDLYSTLYLPPLDKSFDLFGGAVQVARNTSMMDYLSNLAGLNIADVDIGRTIQMSLYLASKGRRESYNYFWNSIDNGVSNLMYNLYRRLGAVKK